MTESAFALDGDITELGRLADEVARFCRENQLGVDVEFDLNVALDELFTNAVRHGGCHGLERAAGVFLQFTGGEVEVLYSDRGEPFDPTTAPEADLEKVFGEPPAGGLGLHLLRGLMQDIRYERAGEWNRVTMRRKVEA